LQQRDRVLDVGEAWVKVEGAAEVLPYVPSHGVGALTAGSNACGGNCLDKAKFMADSISLGGLTSVNILDPEGVTCNGGYRAKQTLLFYFLLF
jgi:hypothetical protein